MIQEILQTSTVFLRMVAEEKKELTGTVGEYRDFGGPFVPLGSDAFNKIRFYVHYSVS